MAFLAAIPAVLGSLATAGTAAATAGAAGAAATSGITLGSVLTATSGLLGAFGAVTSGIAGANAAKYQAGIANLNSLYANDNAARAQERSQSAQLEQDALTRAQIGQQEAIQSASGLGGRSQMLTRKASIELGRQDALRTIESGELEAYNFRNQSAAFKSEASVANSRASNSMLSGFLNAGNSLISAAGSLANPNRFSLTQRKAT